MEDEKEQNTMTRLEGGLSRRDFVKFGFAFGQAVLKVVYWLEILQDVRLQRRRMK